MGQVRLVWLRRPGWLDLPDYACLLLSMLAHLLSSVPYSSARQAKFLDVILYSREQIRKENEAHCRVKKEAGG